MVAILILHGKADLDWATALSKELKEHSPVRFQVGKHSPQITFGPSVVRIALWSAGSAAEGISEAMSALIGQGLKRSILVSRPGVAAPPGLETTALAESVVADDARQTADTLRSTIPQVASAAITTAKQEIVRIETIKDARLRALDNIALVMAALALAATAVFFNWGGARTALSQALNMPALAPTEAPSSMPE